MTSHDLPRFVFSVMDADRDNLQHTGMGGDRDMKYGCVYWGWAIHSRSDEGHGFIGRFWWFGSYHIPAHMRGHMIALFETRAEARQALPQTRITFPRSKIIRVKVIVEEIG